MFFEKPKDLIHTNIANIKIDIFIIIILLELNFFYSVTTDYGYGIKSCSIT